MRKADAVRPTWLGLWATALMLFANTVCLAREEVTSAAYTIPFCEKEVTKSTKEFMGGVCMGMMSMATFMSRSLAPEARFCPPDTITPKESAIVVIKFAKAHSDRKSENFKRLTLDAMRAEWPCK